MRFISLFSGIGGLDLGLERAGMECVAQVEIDDFCQRVLQKHWPDVPKFKDVRDVGKHNLPKADAIVGGFPCQPHSLAGKRRGAADDRNLWPEYLRVVREIKPRFVIGENVFGIVTTILDEVIVDLESIGYTCQPFIIPACAVNAPHRRDRVFIIAHPSSFGRNIGRDNRGERYLLRNSNGYAAKNKQERQRRECGIGASGSNATHSDGGRRLHREVEIKPAEGWEYALRDIATAHWEENWLEVATRLCRVDDGVPNRVDRIRTLGNAVVPQVAEFIGRSIIEIDRQFAE